MRLMKAVTRSGSMNCAEQPRQNRYLTRPRTSAHHHPPPVKLQGSSSQGNRFKQKLVLDRPIVEVGAEAIALLQQHYQYRIAAGHPPRYLR